jgi:glycosyltransferase involved in cell wall biosynthesis
MKILILNSLYRPHDIGGAERSVEILARGLKEKGIEPVIVSTAENDAADTVDGIKSYYLKIPNLYWMRTAKSRRLYKKPFWHLLDSYNPFARSKLADIIRVEKPDIFHSNNLGGFSVYAWKVASSFYLPIVHTIRDHYLICPNAVMYRKDKRCEKQCFRCALFSLPRKYMSSRVGAVIGVSEFILTKHLEYGYFNNAGIKTHIYSPGTGISDFRNYDRKDGQVIFGFVGMLAPIKGIEYLLRRFSAVPLKDAKLNIYGSGITGDYERRLMDKHASENIRFMGHRKPDEIYGEIDVLIIPSLCDDAFPRVLIESYSNGVPVIATILGGASEMVEEGRTGFTFDPSVDGDLEKKIAFFIEGKNISTRMMNDCLAAAGEFDIEKATKKHIQIYEGLLRQEI